MNLFQAKPGKRVEVLMTSLTDIGPMPSWLPAEVIRRNFYREEVEVEFTQSFGHIIILQCEEGFELPRLRLAGGG